MHTKGFLTGNNPYANLHIAQPERVEIINNYCNMIAALGVRIINVVIVKPRITKPQYLVLDTALRYSMQRVENDLKNMNMPDERFMIITDQGRVPMMRAIARRMQKVNFVPSIYEAAPQRLEITRLVEDPLPKDSKDSYFIQIADLVSYLVYIYSAVTTHVARPPGRLSSYVSDSQTIEWMKMLMPALNLKANPRDPYGIKFHPAA